MNEPDRKNWYQKTWVRVLLLLLLPLVAGGLYLISTRLTVSKPKAVPVAPETPVPDR